MDLQNSQYGSESSGSVESCLERSRNRLRSLNWKKGGTVVAFLFFATLALGAVRQQGRMEVRLAQIETSLSPEVDLKFRDGRQAIYNETVDLIRLLRQSGKCSLCRANAMRTQCRQILSAAEEFRSEILQKDRETKAEQQQSQVRPVEDPIGETRTFHPPKKNRKVMIEIDRAGDKN